MKIIGNSKDYYDSALRYGHDSKLLFNRTFQSFYEFSRDEKGFKEHAFMFDGMPSPETFTKSNRAELALTPFRVAFCGRTYNGIRARLWGRGESSRWDDPSKVDFFYDAEALARLVDESGLVHDEKDTARMEERMSPMLKFLQREEPRRNGFFFENAEPIVLAKMRQGMGGRTVMLNPTLQELSFFKVLDAWQAFQELEMFLGGLAAPENGPPVVIADKDRVAQHGFDKMSFRKQPTKRRRV